MMGGLVDVRISVGEQADSRHGHGRHGRRPRAAEPEAQRVLDRIEIWAARLTRFDEASELSRLNADPRTAVPIGPTLAAVLDWARVAEVATDGTVDAALLDARLAAEKGIGSGLPTDRRWSLERTTRGALVRRSPGVRFDLDGLAKGWLADRALRLVRAEGSALVDADGDVAVRLAAGIGCAVGIADPHTDGGRLATIRVPAAGCASRYGIATSGTTVHRWRTGAGTAHHLIDPRTRRPAVTDVAQATVIAASARHAEALAKTIVILGYEAGLALLGRTAALGAVLLTERSGVLATGVVAGWLA